MKKIKKLLSIVLSLSLLSCTTGIMQTNNTLAKRDQPEKNKGYLTLNETRYCMYEELKNKYYIEKFSPDYCREEKDEISLYKNVCNFNLISKNDKIIILKEIEKNRDKILGEAKPLEKSCFNKKVVNYTANTVIIGAFATGLIIDPIVTLKVVGGIYLGAILLMGIATETSK